MSVTVWRIASDTPDWTADDLTGEGAKRTGGRWNRQGIPVVYASSSRALACLETFVHLNSQGLPLNRYLVELTVPDAAWENREIFEPEDHVGWDASPPGLVSMDWGTAWARKRGHLVAEVPSVIVPEEANLLLNPVHPEAKALTARKVREWTYDLRIVRPEAY